MAGLRGLKRLSARVAMAHQERDRQRHDRDVARSRVLLGAYGLDHLDAHGRSSRIGAGDR